MRVNANSTWLAPVKPEKGSEIGVYVVSSSYNDGVKLSFGDAFKVTLTPEQAMDLGHELAAVGAYHRIFSARYGVAERDATIIRPEALSSDECTCTTSGLNGAEWTCPHGVRYNSKSNGANDGK